MIARESTRSRRPIIGVTSLSATAKYATPSPGGIAGTAHGLWAGLMFAIDSLAVVSNPRPLIGRISIGTTNGWYLNTTGTNGALGATLYQGAGVGVNPSGGTITASDVRKVQAAVLYHDRIAGYLWRNRIEAGRAALSGFRPHTGAMEFGPNATFTSGDGYSLMDACGGNAFPTPAFLRRWFDAVRRFGSVPREFSVPTVPSSYVDTTLPFVRLRAADAVVSVGNVTHIPNIGVASGQANVMAGTLSGPANHAAINNRPALTPSGAAYLKLSLSPSAFRFLHEGPAETWHFFVPGGSGSSMTLGATVNGSSLTTQTGFLLSCYNSAGTELLSFLTANGTATTPFNSQPSHGSQSGGYGMIVRTRFRRYGAPEFTLYTQNAVRSYGNLSSAPAAADPQSSLNLFSAVDGANLGNSSSWAESVYFDRLLTDDEADYMELYGASEYGIGNASMEHRWPIRDSHAGAVSIDLSNAAASIADSVTNAVSDLATATGSPKIRRIDPMVDGRNTCGVLGFSGTCHLTTSTPGGVRGSVNGFSFVHHTILWSLSGTEVLFHCANSAGTQGWYLVREAATLRWYSSNGVGGIASSPTRTLTAGDLGRPLMIYGVRDGAGMLYLYLDGVSVGAAIGPVASYALASWATMIGVNQALANPAVSMSWLGSAGGSGSAFILDASEVAAHYAESVSLGRIATHVKLEHVWFPHTDIVAGGGPSAGIPAQVQDSVGTDHLTRVGGLVVSSGGVSGYSGTDKLVTVGGGIAGIATGCWGETLVTLSSLVNAQVLFGRGDASTLGWYFRTRLTGLGLNISNGTGYVTVEGACTTGLHHAAFVFTGSYLKFFIDGVLAQTVAHAGYAPSTTGGGAQTSFGVAAVSTWPFSTGAMHGGSGGHAVPSDGEILIAATAALSTGKVVGVPGKTDRRYSLVDDIAEAGGKIPAVWRERVSGVDHMITVGSGLQVAQRIERIYSWEAA